MRLEYRTLVSAREKRMRNRSVAIAVVGVIGAAVGVGIALTSGGDSVQHVATLGSVTTTSTTNAPVTTTTSTVNGGTLATGDYADSPSAPHYVLTVNANPAGFVGWLYFVYQDGRTSETFHYNASTNPDGTFVLHTDTPSAPFSVGRPPPYPQAGSSTIPPGNTYTGTDRDNTVRLDNCGTYLYWASPSNTSGSPASCIFTYQASG